jgi:hypothetical protein
MDTFLIIYLATAILGTLIYNYAGYLKYGKPRGESFDWAKWLDTLIKGGGTATLLTYITAATAGTTEFSILILFNAFINGLALSAGIDTLTDVVSNKKTEPENLNGLIKAISDLAIRFKQIEDKLQPETEAQKQSTQVVIVPPEVNQS